MRLGQGASTAAQLAYGRAYQQMLRQASMLSYKNAFFILSITILCLAPLPFLMKRPPQARKPAPDARRRAGGQRQTTTDDHGERQEETHADGVLTEVV
jgi:hypothetical protein